jgi:hypothetical protein
MEVDLGVGEVLHEGAAAGDVEQLHPAADAEHRQVAIQRRLGEGDLEPVPLDSRVLRQRIALRAVGGRVEIGAAGQQQAVQQIDEFAGLDCGCVARREQQGQAAGAIDSLRVGALRDVDFDLLPRRPPGAFHHRADPDNRAAHQSRSKPRKRSQSVTVLSIASSSTRARFR